MSQLVDQLQELTTLKEKGALSEDEFQAAKAKLLSPEVQPIASATSFVELSFDPVGTWKSSHGMFLGGDGCVSFNSSTLVITRAGADTLTVEAKDASMSGCCYCGGGEGMFESSSTFTIKPMTGTFEGMLWGGLAGFKANFKFINEKEIQTTFVNKKSMTFTRQSQDGSLMPIAPAGDVTMNRD